MLRALHHTQRNAVPRMLQQQQHIVREVVVMGSAQGSLHLPQMYMFGLLQGTMVPASAPLAHPTHILLHTDATCSYQERVGTEFPTVWRVGSPDIVATVWWVASHRVPVRYRHQAHQGILRQMQQVTSSTSELQYSPQPPPGSVVLLQTWSKMAFISTGLTSGPSHQGWEGFGLSLGDWNREVKANVLRGFGCEEIN